MARAIHVEFNPPACPQTKSAFDQQGEHRGMIMSTLSLLDTLRGYAQIAFGGLIVLVLVTLFASVTYNIYFHPLADYPGPWYFKASSRPLALLSYVKREHEWLLATTRKYGGMLHGHSMRCLLSSI